MSYIGLLWGETEGKRVFQNVACFGFVCFEFIHGYTLNSTIHQSFRKFALKCKIQSMVVFFFDSQFVLHNILRCVCVRVSEYSGMQYVCKEAIRLGM